MPIAGELKAKDFFATRHGVCVYVTVNQHTLRVQFATADARGVVTEGSAEEAAEAARIARTALQDLAPSIAPVFTQIARNLT